MSKSPELRYGRSVDELVAEFEAVYEQAKSLSRELDAISQEVGQRSSQPSPSPPQSQSPLPQSSSKSSCVRHEIPLGPIRGFNGS